MKQTFTQFLTESRIQVPQDTLRDIMNVVASAYFSDLMGRIKKSGQEPSPQFQQALQDAQAKYGEFDLHELTDETPYIGQKVKFDTKGLPERYRKRVKRDFVINVVAGPMGIEANSGEYQPLRKGKASDIRINTSSVARNLNAAIHNPEIIQNHLRYLEATADHELQHKVQQVALSKLHPEQSGNDKTRRAGQTDDDTYYASNEEFLPQITSAAALFKNSIRGERNPEEIKNKFYDTVDPRRGNALPFFASLFKQDSQKWKKAVKEFHRLVQA